MEINNRFVAMYGLRGSGYELVIKRKLQHFLNRYRILKFGILGAITSILHFALLYLFVDCFHVFYIVSAVIVLTIDGSISYIFNHLWTFERAKIRHGWFVGWLEYLSLCGLAQLSYIGMLAFFTEIVGFWYIFSAMMAILLNFPIKYLVLSKFVWRMSK